MGSVVDSLHRPLRNLRISVTDRCNLRCTYCMPEQHYRWLPQPEILSFEEISLLVDVFTSLGVRKVRLTGGEPLLRRDLHTLVHLLAKKPLLQDLSLTTNGILLEAQVEHLHQAGLQRLTISLDTLRRDRFLQISKRDELPRILGGIQKAASVPWKGPLKIDAVVMRGVNDDELLDLINFATTVHAEVRFIEYMDVGGATQWNPQHVVSRKQMLEAITRTLGSPVPISDDPSAPAERFRLPDGRTFGIIASTTTPFCRHCDRARLTADGQWLTCLYAATGMDLKKALREGASHQQLHQLLEQTWALRDDRGAEKRLELTDGRSALFQAAALKAEPHLEMHTRGG